jgi:hypothetical protein
MTYSDKVGEDYRTSVAKLFSNQNLAMQYFGTGGAKSGPSVTPSDALVAELNSNFLDIFNAAPDKKTASAYAKEVQQLEIKQKGAISAQQREDIRLKYIQRTASTRYKTVTGTADTADDAMLQEGALGATVRTLRQAYSNNGVPINESEIYKKAIQATRSPQALENILNVTKQQATALFPAFKDLIAQGADVSDLVSPYASIYSQIYNKPISQLKPSDFYDVASGDKPISPDAYKKTLYARPEFKDTDTYMNKKQSALSAIVRAFGIGPT